MPRQSLLQLDIRLRNAYQYKLPNITYPWPKAECKQQLIRSLKLTPIDKRVGSKGQSLSYRNRPQTTNRYCHSPIRYKGLRDPW